MKKFLCFVLIFSVALAMAACKQPGPEPDSTSGPTETTTISNTETTGETATDLPVAQKPMISVSVPVITETATAEDGAVIFISKHQNISLIVPDPEVADNIIISFLNAVDTAHSNAQAVKDAAIAKYNGQVDWVPYLNQVTYNPTRIDSSVLSFFGTYVTYSGAAHPETAYLPVSYDFLTGHTLRLKDVLTDTATADQLTDLVTEALNTQKEEKFLYEDFDETVDHRFHTGFSHDTGWFFSQEGLCFYFAPYDIAPYVSGVIIAEIPYSKLVGVLKDAYFPAEQESVSGDLQISEFNENALNNFSQISEIILNEGGEKALLYTDSAVYNIRIESGSWNSKGTIFTPAHTVFAASTLTPGDTIMIEGVTTEELPSLRIQYDMNGKTVLRYIVCNNNTFSLISA